MGEDRRSGDRPPAFAKKSGDFVVEFASKFHTSNKPSDSINAFTQSAGMN